MEVIKGWDIGVSTMKVGEKSVFHIPPSHAYGDAQVGPIPPRSHLTFEIELLESRDDRIDKMKWQLLYFLIFLVVIVCAAPAIQDHGHHGLLGGIPEYWQKSFGNAFGDGSRKP